MYKLTLNRSKLLCLGLQSRSIPLTPIWFTEKPMIYAQLNYGLTPFCFSLVKVDIVASLDRSHTRPQCENPIQAM